MQSNRRKYPRFRIVGTRIVAKIVLMTEYDKALQEGCGVEVEVKVR